MRLNRIWWSWAEMAIPFRSSTMECVNDARFTCIKMFSRTP